MGWSHLSLTAAGGRRHVGASKGELADALRDVGFGIDPRDPLARHRVTLPSQISQNSRAQPPDPRVVRRPGHEPIQHAQAVDQVAHDLVPRRDREESVRVAWILSGPAFRGEYVLSVCGRWDDLDTLPDRVSLQQLVVLHGSHRRSRRRERGSSRNAGRLIGNFRRDSGIVFGGSTKWTRSAPTRGRCERPLATRAVSGASIMVRDSETSGIEPSFTAMRVRIWSSARLTLIDCSADRYRRGGTPLLCGWPSRETRSPRDSSLRNHR